ncbi:hypothetical protein OsJ_15530 [Oryza sativa Japonica Group]|jgi:hypothetical protein|uniref:Uncharacterized protein n=1 Tax=Oryza sativa subsp. japonica TaxID=39947 RepID=B9FG88_ORYSJ|nr:hypothetical protein OsJ_15530 [Oryza sativa Japonica Group]
MGQFGRIASEMTNVCCRLDSASLSSCNTRGGESYNARWPLPPSTDDLPLPIPAVPPLSRPAAATGCYACCCWALLPLGPSSAMISKPAAVEVGNAIHFSLDVLSAARRIQQRRGSQWLCSLMRAAGDAAQRNRARATAGTKADGLQLADD